ncbi:LysR family transcriptional regulator [Salipiger sp.]|uniref:LysR family transcriptional regulator n=1 Tax=Salipiger sp. TaxID=2078585 RepID=UPI003A9826A9
MPQAISTSLRHLRLFRTLSETRHFRRTADLMNLSQPAVSQAIAGMEAEIGVALFERTTAASEPTAAGQRLAAGVERLFARVEAALTAAGAASRPDAPVAQLANRLTRRHLAALRSMEATRDGAIPLAEPERARTYRAAHELERLIGVTLVSRGVGGLRLTETGARLAQDLAAAEALLNDTVRAIRAGPGPAARLRIGSMAMTASYIAAPAIDAFARRYPDCRVEVRTCDCRALIDGLRRGDYDLVVGIVHLARDAPDLIFRTFGSLPYLIVARRGHPLAARDRVELGDLAGVEWLSPPEQSARRRVVDRILSHMPGASRSTFEIGGFAAQSSLIRGSDRLGVMTRFEFRRDNHDGGMVALPCTFELPPHRLGLTCRTDWQPTPEQACLVGLLQARTQRIIEELAPSRPQSAPLSGSRAEARLLTTAPGHPAA